MPGVVVSQPAANPATLAVLTADLSAISAQTTLQNITGLGLSIGASSTEMWLVRWHVIVSSANGTMDLKFGMTGPASATCKWGTYGIGSEVASWGARSTANAQQVLATISDSVSVASAGGVMGISLLGVVYGGGTAGTIQLQYAQATSDAGNLQILKGTMLEAFKVAA